MCADRREGEKKRRRAMNGMNTWSLEKLVYYSIKINTKQNLKERKRERIEIKMDRNKKREKRLFAMHHE